MQPKQSKAHQIRVERELTGLFKLPGNDRCADCGSKNPRWASYSLGIFLCIRCASLHRKMGTHISKVKSTSMDCWTLQEVENIKTLGGNQMVNKQINALGKLPVAIDDDLLMEKYIRDKWERKLFQEQVRVMEVEIAPTPSLSSTESSIISSPTSERDQHLSLTHNQLSESNSSSSVSFLQHSGSTTPSTAIDQQAPTKHFSLMSTPTTASRNPANPFNTLVDKNISNCVGSNDVLDIFYDSNSTNNNNPFRSFVSSPSPGFSNSNVSTIINGSSSGHTQQQHLFNTFNHNIPPRASTLPVMSSTSSNPFLQQQQQQQHLPAYWPTGHQ